MENGNEVDKKILSIQSDMLHELSMLLPEEHRNGMFQVWAASYAENFRSFCEWVKSGVDYAEDI